MLRDLLAFFAGPYAARLMSAFVGMNGHQQRAFTALAATMASDEATVPAEA